MTTPPYETMQEDHRVPVSLANQIEELFTRAEPRLLRLARSQQVAPDAAEDIVQETLLEAWKSLDQLRDETRFAAWLEGICRNVCRRYQRKQGILQARETMLENPDEADEVFAHLADPDTFDPAEELTRRELIFLLDRALSYLAPESRMMVEQHYLDEIPQRELAERMGLSLSALEARLHRTRKQILHVLGHDLREDALALGLAINPADAMGWRETQIHCIFCGKQRMVGIFEPMADGRVNMRLRCPSCMSMEMNSVGLIDLTTARSFLPATKRVLNEAGRFYMAAMANGGRCHCWVCHQPAQLHVIRDEYFAPQLGLYTYLATACACRGIFTPTMSLYGSLPKVREFLLGIGRVVLLPEVEMTYHCQPAIRFGMLDLTDGRQAHVYADARTLLPLDVIVE